MPLSHIEHLLLLVDDVDATADWFVENIGMERGHTPDFKVPVTWLYIGERDVLHIAHVPSEGKEKRFQDRYLGGRVSQETNGTGIIDHVAFRCTRSRAPQEQVLPAPHPVRRCKRRPTRWAECSRQSPPQHQRY